MSVRTELMERLGINKYQAQNLIKTYARNHNGKINVDQIVKDIQSMAKTMVNEIGNIYKDYDIAHEILDCGKDRQYDGISSLLSNEEMKLANTYLANNYYENVDIWATTLHASARNTVQSVLASDIDSYREFVDKLPYRNISRVSRVFDLESEVAEFLALNGEFSDFQKFMTDVQPTRDGKLERRSCPKNISIKLFEKVQESLDKNGMIEFNRGNIIRGLSTIYNNNNLDDMQKEELQNLYMSYSLRNAFDESLIKFSKIGRYEELKEYMNMQPETTWEEREAFLTQKISPSIKQKMENEYQELLTNLKAKDKSELIDPEKIMETLRQSGLTKKR